MPQVTDPALLAQLNSGAPPSVNVQPQPFPPGTVTGPTIQSPRIRALGQADTRIGFDSEQNARAWEALDLDRQRFQRDQEKWNKEKRTSEMNAGVDTTASQDQAVGHAIMLRNHLQTLRDVFQKGGEEAARPTWKEWGVSKVTSDDPTLVGAVQPVNRQRASTAYRGVLESAIWLYTGAAAPVEQVQNIRASVEPLVSDKKETLEDKRRALLTIIAQAQARAGPANAKVQEALEFLRENTDLLYGESFKEPNLVDTENETELTRGKGDTKAIPIPPAMQAEYNQFIAAVKPGQLKLDQYVGYYNDLAKRYGIEGGVDLTRAKEFVNAFNKGERTSRTLPPPIEEQNAWEKLSGGAAASPLGTGIKNFASAMTMGIPELLAGSEGRAASQIADEINPNSAITGEVLGSIVPGLGLEKGAATLAVKGLGLDAADRGARIGSDMAANALYGGVTEYNQTGDADEALTNALIGGGAVPLTRGVAKGFGELRPKGFRQGLKDLGEQPILDDAGEQIGKITATDLTTAQRAGIGGGEEFLSGLPGVSPMRQQAVASYNRHNAERAMAKAGLTIPKNIQPGQEMNAYVHKTLQQEYDKLAPSIKGKIDTSYKNAFAGIRNTVLTAPKGKSVDPEIADMWQRIEDANAMFVQGGKFDYEAYKKFTAQLREWQDFWAKATVGTNDAPSPLANEMARVADKVRMKARELVSRANPAAGARLKRLDSAWAHKLRIEEASKGAAAQERGVYAPSEALSAIQRMDTSKGKGAFARGQAFDQQYAQSAQEVLGGKPAKGGSVLATGALGYTVGGTVLSPALVAAYAPGIKRLTQALTDGRLGAKLDKLTPEAVAKQFPELPTDIIKQVLTTYVREKTVGN